MSSLAEEFCETGAVSSLHELVSLICKCKQGRNYVGAISLHDEIRKKGLEVHPSLGNHLVSMWVELGSMCHAREVFDKLPYQDNSSWNALIRGYVNSGDMEQALTLYQIMQGDNTLHSSAHTFIALAKACAVLEDVERGHQLYLHVVGKGLLEWNLFLASSFVSMFAKCGATSRAQALFDKLPSKDIILWTALIKGYADHGPSEEAFKCLEQMQGDGISPDAAALICILKACTSTGDIGKGLETHGLVAKKGLLEGNDVLGSSIVDMYAKFGMLGEAQNVFGKLSERDVVSWTALFSGYAEHGDVEEALNIFDLMQCNGVLPSSVTFVWSLKACGDLGTISKGRRLHAELYGSGLQANIYLGSALVDMYVKCRSLDEAQKAFDELTVRNVVSWNALLTGYSEHGHGEEALYFLKRMKEGGTCPDSVSFVCSLKACASLGAIDRGREMYVDVVSRGLESDIVIGNTLIDMFVKCHLLEEARVVLVNLPYRNVVSWTALLVGYCEDSYAKEALTCLEEMRKDGIYPSAATFVCSVKACSINKETEAGQSLHIELTMAGLEKDTTIGNTLVDLYASSGWFSEACQVFDKLPARDVITWNTLAAGLLEHNQVNNVLGYVEQMWDQGIAPDATTFLYVLNACCNRGAIHKGREIHAELIKQGRSEEDVSANSTLIAMYAQHGFIEEAQKIFDNLRARSLASWNAILVAYAEHERSEEALKCFEQMQSEGSPPDAVTFVYCLKACGSTGARKKAQDIHTYLVHKGLEAEPLISNTIVYVYSKCGLMAMAQAVFDSLCFRNVISWTALIAGYAQLGNDEGVFQTFVSMEKGGIEPDLVTLGSVLGACSHAGLVDEGQVYFEAMSKEYDLIPAFWHYVCMIDLFGRASHFEKAIVVSLEMPFQPTSLVWHTMAGACRKWGNVELGMRVFEQSLQLDEHDVPAFICMLNIYEDAVMRADLDRLQSLASIDQSEHDWWTDSSEVPPPLWF